ncbi:U24-ctenitoxin-Pn1a-like [Stegodyphus dumicola]|uniref:U24-ctenitoxin-Pn1a-like n=1 Tax=Stegodyphus dumicola TaxID=202533 RepID=UPI0015AA0AA0|nr:U24-ctenitoxin-Pn1a-like [Stegodyphus dumicola]
MKSVCCILVVTSFCLVGILAKTQCEENRERQLKSYAKVKFVPKCDADGDYEALQCFEGTPFCMCCRPDGSHITEPSKYIRTCVCDIHRDRELNRSKNGFVGNFVPGCEADGTYSRKQCKSSTSYCWCADENGKKVSEEVRGKLDC